MPVVTLRLRSALGVIAALLAFAAPVHAQWVNEIHYDDSGLDKGEGIEVILPVTADPSAFDLFLYNGSVSLVYEGPLNLEADFTEGETVGGFTVYSIGVMVENGAPDGIALAQDGVLVPGQFLSYEGTFTAIGGPANGVTSTDIGVSESSGTPAGTSLQLIGSGMVYDDFVWQGMLNDSFGEVNAGQTLIFSTNTRLQLIHNAPDPAVEEVDIYVNGELFEDDVAFRTATPFIDIPGLTALEIAVAPSDSDSAADAFFVDTYMFDADETYQLFVIGVREGDFEPNPDGNGIDFRIRDFAGGRTEADAIATADLNFFNGTTDAPRLDLRGGAGQSVLLFNNVLYGRPDSYETFDAEPQVVQVTNPDGSISFGLFDLDFSDRAGEAGTILASGFLTPDNEDDTGGTPPSFGLLIVFADGSETFVRPTGVSTEADGMLPSVLALGAPYPNPVVGAAARLTVPFTLASAAEVELTAYDVLGREVAVLAKGVHGLGAHRTEWDVASLPSGVYVVRIEAGGEVQTRRMTLVR